MGYTTYPDTNPTTLWVVEVEEFCASFLVMQSSPAASAPSVMELFTIQDGRVPVHAASIKHHYEWDATVAAADVARDLFIDSDGDGIPELEEPDVWKWGGTVTFHEFDGTEFHPLWIETYDRSDAPDYCMKLVARKRAPRD